MILSWIIVCSINCHMVCVWKMQGVVHDTLIEHRVEHHLPYVVFMDNGEEQCVMEHAVERRLPIVVCVKSGGCGA